MAVLWTDGTWTAAYAVTAPEFESPIPGVATAYVFRQDYMQLATQFAAEINTAHGTYTDFYIVAESPRQPLGGGVVKWTRTYAKIPSSHSEWETHAYNFIGYFGSFGVNTTTVTGRDRKVLSVLSQVLHEYFLCAAGQTYETPGAIPRNAKTPYYYSAIDYPVDYIGDSPPLAAATTPSKTAYAAAIADATSNAWDATVANFAGAANGGRLIAEDSTIDRWMGNIWVRRTRYVLAQ